MIALPQLIADVPAIGLAELDEVASLQTRTDRKYVLRSEVLQSALSRIDVNIRVLEIDQQRQFGYESTYFDTPRFDHYLAAARRRPRRCKIRSRSYCDTELTFIEAKLRNRLGQTEKRRIEKPFGDRHHLTASDVTFVSGLDHPGTFVDELEPTVTTRFDRVTLLVGPTRATFDSSLRCSDGSDTAVGLGNHIIVETKNRSAPGPLDRALWRAGVRPTVFSKYALGMAALHPDLPANKWHRTFTRHAKLIEQ